MTTSANGVTFYSLAGTISKASVTYANPSDDDSEIVFFGAVGGGYSIMASAPDGSGVRTILAGPSVVSNIKVVGAWVYFLENNNTLKRVLLSGGSSSILQTNVLAFTPNPAGTKLFYIEAPTVTYTSGRMMSCNPDGTAVTFQFLQPFLFQQGVDSFPGCLSDGTLVLADNQGSSSTVFTSRTTNGSVLGSYNHSNGIDTAGMLNGSNVVFMQDSGYFERFFAAGAGTWARETLTGAPIPVGKEFAISPSGGKVAFALADPNSPGIAVEEVTGSGGVKVNPQTCTSVAWCPFVTSRSFVGAGSSFSSSGAFLFSQLGAQLPSVVWGDATTRSTISFTKVSVDGAANVVYRMDCDQITKLYYTKTRNFAPVPVVTAASGLKGALLSFEASTGQLDTIATFAANIVIAPTLQGTKASGRDLKVVVGHGKVSAGVSSPNTLNL